MKRIGLTFNRRTFLTSMGALGMAAGLGPGRAFAASGAALRRAIPASGQTLPVIGMGSWITFNVGDDPEVARDPSRQGAPNLLR